MTALREHIEAARLIDHHVHGCWLSAGDRSRFENALNEANTEPLAPFDSAFDTQLGFAVRAHCAPLLGLSRHADADAYWQCRSAVPEPELATSSSWLRPGCPIGWSTPDSPGEWPISTTWLLSRSGGCTRWFGWSRSPNRPRRRRGTAAAFDDILWRHARNALATKTILAYRGGFLGDLSDPSPAEVDDAAARWRADGGTRLNRIRGLPPVRPAPGAAARQATAVPHRVRRPGLRPARRQSCSPAGLSARQR